MAQGSRENISKHDRWFAFAETKKTRKKGKLRKKKINLRRSNFASSRKIRTKRPNHPTMQLSRGHFQDRDQKLVEDYSEPDLGWDLG